MLIKADYYRILPPRVQPAAWYSFALSWGWETGMRGFFSFTERTLNETIRLRRGPLDQSPVVTDGVGRP